MGILGGRNCMCKLTEDRTDVAQLRGHQGVLPRVPREGTIILCVDVTTMPTRQVVFFSTTAIENCDLDSYLTSLCLSFRIYI